MHVISASIFMVSLISLYLSSTLCHSFFLMRDTGAIFGILDHAMINVLIAGTYTPFMMVVLGDMPYSGWMLALIWAMAIVGVAVACLEDKRLQNLRLGLYIGMGWMIVLSGNTLVQSLTPTVLQLLAVGGVAYTSGVYFYIKGQEIPMYHALWHLFVIVGSSLHFVAIWLAFFHSQELAGPNGDGPSYATQCKR